MDAKHWDKVYRTKSESEVSWYQGKPTKSLELIKEFGVGPSEKVIDVGGGESHLVDHLIPLGFKDISILDISTAALEKTRTRLGKNAASVQFICSDVTMFDPKERYGLWHDRATFHFLTKPEDVAKYLEIVNQAILPGGHLIVSTFSTTGPDKCSGLPVSKYSDSDLKSLFEKHFVNIKCVEERHHTPWNSAQNFVYCGFKKREA